MANFQRKRKAKTKTYRAAKLKKLSETVEQQDKELTTELDHMETLSQVLLYYVHEFVVFIFVVLHCTK